MPLILFVVTAAIYLCLFVHNRAFLTCASYEAAVCGSLEGIRKGGDPEGAALERALLLGNTGFFGGSAPKLTVSGGQRISVRYEMKTSLPTGGISWGMKAEGGFPLLRPSREVRKRHAA